MKSITDVVEEQARQSDVAMNESRKLMRKALAEIERKNSTHDKEKKKLLDKLNASDNEHERRVQKMIEVHVAAIERLQKRHDRAIRHAVAEREAAVEKLRIAMNNEMKTVLTSHENEMNSKNEDLTEIKRQIFVDKKAVNEVSICCDD